MPGLPQTDYILCLRDHFSVPEQRAAWIRKLGFDPTKQYILVVPSDDKGYSPLKPMVAKLLKKSYPDAEILYKPKSCLGSKKEPNMIDLPGHQLVYNYFFANLIVVLGYGSPYLEGLIMTPRTVLYIPPVVYSSHRKYRKIPKFGSLLIAHKPKELANVIQRTTKKTVHAFPPAYFKDVKRFMKTYVGSTHFLPVSRLIIEDIRKRLPAKIQDRPTKTIGNESEEVKNDQHKPSSIAEDTQT
jgi:hypothetical protein